MLFVSGVRSLVENLSLRWFGKLTLSAVSSCCDCRSTADRKSMRYRGHPVGTSAAARHQQVSAGRTPPAGSVGSGPSGIVPDLLLLSSKELLSTWSSAPYLPSSLDAGSLPPVDVYVIVDDFCILFFSFSFAFLTNTFNLFRLEPLPPCGRYFSGK